MSNASQNSAFNATRPTNGSTQKPRTMVDKIWEAHQVYSETGQPDILYIDLHLVHEVTSPQAFEGLRLAGRKVRRAELTVATADHNVPTTDRALPIADPISRQQIETLRNNCREFGIRHYDLDNRKQGIVHIIGPELGLTQPGMTIVCGDSHTATHALGALGFRHRHERGRTRFGDANAAANAAKNVRVARRWATRCGRDGQGRHPLAHRPYHDRWRYRLRHRVHRQRRAKFENVGAAHGLQYVDRSRARAGMIAPDRTTYEYLRGREFAPKNFDAAVEHWEKLPSDPGAVYDRVEVYQAADITPQVTWGTNPGQVVAIDAAVPNPSDFANDDERKTAARALEYMDLKPGVPITTIPLDRVFIGSCTNARIEDLRAAAAVVGGYRVAPGINAMVVPGSGQVKQQAEAEGLDRIFRQAGFEWREAGCSMCLGMNPDTLKPGERCASTSNRNFEGRQGRGGRTHLVSPAMAAAAAVTGHFVDIRQWKYKA